MTTTKAWDRAAYYQLLIERVMRVPVSHFEQIERLAVILLIGLLIENGGMMQWSLTQIRDEIHISEAGIIRTIKKLMVPNNPFWAFLQVRAVSSEEAKRQSYQLSLVDWVSDAVTGDEVTPQMAYETSLPIPSSLAADLPQIFAHYLDDVLWHSEQHLDNETIIQVKVSRKKARKANALQPFPCLTTEEIQASC